MGRDISEMYEDELIDYLSDKLDEINGKIERGELVEVTKCCDCKHINTCDAYNQIEFCSCGERSVDNV